MKGNGKAVPFHFREGFQAAARIIRPPSAGEFHTCGLRRVISNAHVVGNDNQNYFASADAKVCDACLPPCAAAKSATLGCGGLFRARRARKAPGECVRGAVLRSKSAKCAPGVVRRHCFVLREHKLECCFAPGGRKRRIFRFDEA